MTTTDVLVICVFNNGADYGFCFGNGLTDGTEGEIQGLDIGGNSVSFGRLFQGKMLTAMRVIVSDGSLATIKLYNPDGGVRLHQVGNERTAGSALVYNAQWEGLHISVQDGMLLKGTCTD